jgi:hypothetical protein
MVDGSPRRTDYAAPWIEEGMMADELPAWKILPSTARCVLGIIEAAIGPGGTARISKRSFAADHDIGPGTLVPTLKRLRQLGFIEIEKGAAPAVASSFKLSNR